MKPHSTDAITATLNRLLDESLALLSGVADGSISIEQSRAENRRIALELRAVRMGVASAAAIKKHRHRLTQLASLPQQQS